MIYVLYRVAGGQYCEFTLPDEDVAAYRRKSRIKR